MKNKITVQFKTISLYFCSKKWRVDRNNQHNKKENKQLGFSLPEVLAVSGIIGVLMAVAVRSYNKYTLNTRAVAIQSHISDLKKAYQSCLRTSAIESATDTEDSAQCDDVTELKLKYDSSEISITKGTGTGKQCFSVKVSQNFSDDKKHEACIEFDSSSGEEVKKTFDDGTNSGTCGSSTGLCS